MLETVVFKPGDFVDHGIGDLYMLLLVLHVLFCAKLPQPQLFLFLPVELMTLESRVAFFLD